MKNLHQFALGLAAGLGLYLILSLIIPVFTGLLLLFIGITLVLYYRNTKDEKRKAAPKKQA